MNRRELLAVDPLRGRTVRRASAYKRDGMSQTAPIFERRSDTGLEGYVGEWTYTQAAHILRRCMVGPTDQEIRTAVTDGMAATITKLLTGFTPPLDFISGWSEQDPQIRATDPTQQQAFQDLLRQHREDLSRWWNVVISTSPTSIQERMVMFWHGHFTSEFQVVKYGEWMYGQNQLFRQNMFGNFKQMAKDVTKDMAMLIYLDGVKNFKQGSRSNINENYGRELMELFTCGVVDWEGNPNYTEEDVREAARALSGWTFTTSPRGAAYVGRTSQFIELRWDAGTKTVMGQTGNWKADDIVDIIFAQRADQVAKFICGKLYRAFVYDNYDPVVVTEMADFLRASNWELRPLMEKLLASAHFYDTTNIGALQKNPVDYMVGIIRGLGLDNVPDLDPTVMGRGAQDLNGRMSAQGMILFDPPNVKGWPAGRTWVSTSTLPIRQKFLIDVSKAAIKMRGATLYTFDAIAFAKSFPDYASLRKLNDNMSQFLLNTQPSDAERQSLLDTLLAGGVSYEWDIDDPDQKADERLRKFIEAVVQLSKFQLY